MVGVERGTQCATIDCSRVCVCAPVVACLRNVTKVKTSIRIQSAAGHAGYVVCPSRRCCRCCPCVVVLVVAPQVSSKVKPIKRHTPTPPRTLHPTHARILAMLLCASLGTQRNVFFKGQFTVLLAKVCNKKENEPKKIVSVCGMSVSGRCVGVRCGLA